MDAGSCPRVPGLSAAYHCCRRSRADRLRSCPSPLLDHRRLGHHGQASHQPCRDALILMPSTVRAISFFSQCPDPRRDQRRGSGRTASRGGQRGYRALRAKHRAACSNIRRSDHVRSSLSAPSHQFRSPFSPACRVPISGDGGRECFVCRTEKPRDNPDGPLPPQPA